MLNRLTMRAVYKPLAAIATMVVLATGVAFADPHDSHGRDGPRRGFDHYDGRFNHDHYYPSRGYVARDLPRERIIINGGPRGRYWYSGGIWYAPRGPGFVVIGAPLGLFVPVLPPAYTTVWYGGIPYYYANDTYYLWRDTDHQYEVVDPPGDQAAASTQAPPSDDIFVYPKNGQPEDVQAKDKYECHKWAQGESGFDPTQSGGGVAPEDVNAKRDAYHRAMGACLEGRGYSVK
jgi:hypothetical protein